MCWGIALICKITPHVFAPTSRLSVFIFSIEPFLEKFASGQLMCGVLCLFAFLCVSVCVGAGVGVFFFSSANLNRKKLLYYVVMVI